MNILIIGAGGVTSHMLPQLLKMCDPNNSVIAVVDGDELEAKNLDRQLFNKRDIGINKAMALQSIYPKIATWCDYFKHENAKEILDKYNPGLIFVAVDNHQSRLLILDFLDECDSTIGIFGVNEYFDSQAYCYRNEWHNTIADPRIRYPEILEDKSPSPVSCQGEQAESTPQLAIANAMTGCMMMHLFWIWVAKDGVFNEQATRELPYDIRRGISDYSTISFSSENNTIL